MNKLFTNSCSTLLIHQFSTFMLGGLALSSGDGIKYYFNIDYAPLNNLRTTILDVTSATLDTLPPPKHKSLAKPSVPDAIQATIKDILRMKLPPGKQVIIKK